MKKWLAYLSAIMCMVLALCGCGTEIDETVISDSMEIVEDILVDELENMEDEIGDTEDVTDHVAAGSKDDALDNSSSGSSGESSEEEQQEPSEDKYTVVEGGSYTTKEEVALYIYTYGELPANFITKSEAQDLGWVNKEGNLQEVAPGMSIGGDRYGNYEQMLPDGKYKECDINYHGGYRGDERLVYSEDGYIYYTDDHYESFTQLYPEEE